jgi:hypothetical protein
LIESGTQGDAVKAVWLEAQGIILTSDPAGWEVPWQSCPHEKQQHPDPYGKA